MKEKLYCYFTLFYNPSDYQVFSPSQEDHSRYIGSFEYSISSNNKNVKKLKKTHLLNHKRDTSNDTVPHLYFSKKMKMRNLIMMTDSIALNAVNYRPLSILPFSFVIN